MKKIWKVILIIALILLVLGVAISGAAALTGASPQRLYDAIFSRIDLTTALNELLAYFSW